MVAIGEAEHRWSAVTVITATVLFGLAVIATRFTTVWIPMSIAAGLCLAGVLVFQRRSLRRLLTPTWRGIAIGAAIGVAQIAATHAIYAALTALAPAFAESTTALYGLLEGQPGLPGRLPILLLAIVTEELIWRGILYDLLRLRLPAAATVGLCALLYATPHTLSAMPTLPAIALTCGLFWGAERAISSSLVPTIITHLVWDLGIFILLPLVG